VIEALASEGADHPFNKRILPGRTRRRQHLSIPSFAKKDPASASYRRDLGAGDVTGKLYVGVTRGECA
jgi:hypothetical protein